MKRLAFLSAAVGVGAVLVVTGLSVGGSSATSSGYGARSSAARAANSAIGVRRTSLGRTLVDARGRTLYLFEADRANVSNCDTACLGVWPALTGRKTPRAMAGVNAAKIGTVRSGRATRQLSYAKHPLYYYVGDRKPGDVTGEGLDQFGAEWDALAPSGRKIER